MKNLLKGSSRLLLVTVAKVDTFGSDLGHRRLRLCGLRLTFIHVAPSLALTVNKTILFKALKKKISNTYFTINVLRIQIVLKYRFNQTAVPAK